MSSRIKAVLVLSLVVSLGVGGARVFPDGAGGYEMETYLSFEGTPVRYEEGFNFNGIASSADGRYLVTVKSSTGELFRINTTTRRSPSSTPAAPT